MARDARCSFCGRRQDQVQHLVAGLRVFICDGCVGTCAENFSGGESYDRATRTWIPSAPQCPWPHARRTHFGDDVACSFCGTLEQGIQWLVKGGTGPRIFICDECVSLCQEIMAEPPTSPTARAIKGPPSRRPRRFRWPWQARRLDPTAT